MGHSGRHPGGSWAHFEKSVCESLPCIEKTADVLEWVSEVTQGERWTEKVGRQKQHLGRGQAEAQHWK